MFKEEIQRFLGLDVGSDTAERAVFFEAELEGGKWLPLLAGDAFDFLIHLFAGGGDSFALGEA